MRHLFAVLTLMSTLNNSESIKFQDIFEQEYDSSCGYSAIASLMNVWWNIPVTEQELIINAAINNNVSYAISFRSLAETLKQYDFATKSFSMDWEQLKEAIDDFAPALLHLKTSTGHFILALGIKENTIIIADPLDGIKFIEKSKFLTQWSGNVLLAIHPTNTKNTEKLKKTIDQTLERKTLLERTNTLTRMSFR